MSDQQALASGRRERLHQHPANIAVPLTLNETELTFFMMQDNGFAVQNLADLCAVWGGSFTHGGDARIHLHTFTRPARWQSQSLIIE